MNEITNLLSPAVALLVGGAGGTVLFAQLALWGMNKINGAKRENLDGSLAKSQQETLVSLQMLFNTQVVAQEHANAKLTDQVAAMHAQVEEMHSLIDSYRVLLTKTRNLIAEFEGLIIKAGVVIPEETKARMDKLMGDIQ